MVVNNSSSSTFSDFIQGRADFQISVKFYRHLVQMLQFTHFIFAYQLVAKIKLEKL